MVDFIEGIDDLEYRETIDFNVNQYGHLLIEFLLNSNMCILNSRNCSSTDFTCITSSSVVDFCLVSHEDLSINSELKVCKVTDIIKAIGLETVLHLASFLDHSILTWQIKIGFTMQCSR